MMHLLCAPRGPHGPIKIGGDLQWIVEAGKDANRAALYPIAGMQARMGAASRT